MKIVMEIIKILFGKYLRVNCLREKDEVVVVAAIRVGKIDVLKFLLWGLLDSDVQLLFKKFRNKNVVCFMTVACSSSEAIKLKTFTVYSTF